MTPPFLRFSPKKKSVRSLIPLDRNDNMKELLIFGQIKYGSGGKQHEEILWMRRSQKIFDFYLD